MISRAGIVFTLILSSWPSFGQLTQTFDFTVAKDIPDGSDSGLIDSRTISTSVMDIQSLAVDLDISGRNGDGSGMFNGDLYVTLVHDSGFAVLLNRPGKTDSSPFGYSDQFGFTIKLTDSALLGDVHQYRLTLLGSDSSVLGSSALTGTWAPDGRQSDPAAVTTSDPREALLSSFTHVDPNGIWTLFVADLETGGTSKINGWSLEITSVPESRLCALVTSLLLLGLTMARIRAATLRR